MLHGLATTTICEGSSRRTRCAAPPNFRAVENLRRAWPVRCGPFPEVSPSRRMTKAQRAGIRYEKKVLKRLKESFGNELLVSPWFKFEDRHGTRYCQPDGVLYRETRPTVIEVKLSFTPHAWWQLRKLYEPVVRRAYLLQDIYLVVICKFYDPVIHFPEPTRSLRVPSSRTASLVEWPDHKLDSIGVLRWKI